ncbi:MAG: DNA-protecting protein DprA, partial [Leptotrichia sp.]|nr:DNA-protecting protein DprA [Leptotrichia sp.]
MGWLKLKEVGMKDSHIRKLMNIYKKYDELFLEENFRLFNSGLKKTLEKSRNINLENKIELYERNKVRIIDANSQGYPQKLKELIDYPLFLYVKGKDLNKKLDNERRNIAVVGTRKVTKFGKSACEKIVRELLEYDVTLISGLAEGIDTVALSASVEKDGSTVAVVGSGLDIVYPYENKILWEKISEKGILVSEHPLGTKPMKWNFPKRNRIIAALSDGILIAESFKSGGALITAELGFMMDKEIFAVPGFINYPSFEGCN